MQCKSFFDQFLQMLLSKTFTDKIEEKSFRILLCEKEFFFHISNILNFSVKRVGSHFFHTDGIPFEKESKLKLFIFNLWQQQRQQQQQQQRQIGSVQAISVLSGFDRMKPQTKFDAKSSSREKSLKRKKKTLSILIHYNGYFYSNVS